jgi:hypothetical protein
MFEKIVQYGATIVALEVGTWSLDLIRSLMHNSTMNIE